MVKGTENVEIKDLTVINSESFLNKIKHFIKYILGFCKNDNNILEECETSSLEVVEDTCLLDSVLNDYIKETALKENLYKNENYTYYKDIYNKLDEGNISILDVSPDDFSCIMKFRKTEYEIIKK